MSKMRVAIVVVVAALGVRAQNQYAQDRAPGSNQPQKTRTFPANPNETALIRALIESQEKAWNARNAGQYVSSFFEEMEYTDLAGNVISGRSAFQDRLQHAFQTQYKRGKIGYAIRDMQWVRPRVVVCSVDVTISDYSALPPGATTTPGRPLRIRLNWVVTREAAGWIIRSGQETEQRPPKK